MKKAGSESRVNLPENWGCAGDRLRERPSWSGEVTGAESQISDLGWVRIWE